MFFVVHIKSPLVLERSFPHEYIVLSSAKLQISDGLHIADFVRFRPHTYTRTQQSLPPLWAAIRQ